MRVILQGEDQRKAKTWLQFAKSKLRQIKAFTPVGGIINRSYNPVSGVGVYIKSVNGIDTIRITTEGGKYMCNFPTVDRYSIPHSDFQVRCPVSPKASDEFLRLGFLSRSNNINHPSMGGDWDIYAWDFGDGNFDTGASVFHQYAEPGEYTVSLTVSKDVSIYNALDDGGNTGGEYQFGQSVFSQDGFGTHEDIAYARYLAYAPLPGISGGYKWWCSAATSRGFVGSTPTAKKSFEYRSQENGYAFDLTSVPLGSTVTCYMQLLLKDWINHYPNFGDPGHAESGVGSTVVSDIGGSGTPIIGGEFSPWETFNMGDLSPFIGTIKVVNFTDSGSHAQLPAFPPGMPSNSNEYSNVVGVSGGGIWAVVEDAGTLLKTTKTIKVYTGRKGHKKSFQAGDSVHT